MKRTVSYSNLVPLSTILFLLYEILWYPIDDYRNVTDMYYDWRAYCIDYIFCLLMIGINMVIVRAYMRHFQYLKWYPYRTPLMLLALAIFNVVVSLWVSRMGYNAYLWLGYEWPPTDELINAFGLTLHTTFLIIIALFLYAISELREATRQREEELQAASTTQILSLQQQINPHFLFNNLSVAIGLVEEAPHKATVFLSRLASVYRHTLRKDEQMSVSIGDELHNLQDYMSLMTFRHGECVLLQFDEALYSSEVRIFPGALQLLVENVYKHNKLSCEDPIKVNIRVEDDLFIIENDYRPIVSSIASCGIGQNNLKKRYKAIDSDRVSFSHTDELYIVKLPIIHHF